MKFKQIRSDTLTTTPTLRHHRIILIFFAALLTLTSGAIGAYLLALKWSVPLLLLVITQFLSFAASLVSGILLPTTTTTTRWWWSMNWCLIMTALASTSCGCVWVQLQLINHTSTQQQHQTLSLQVVVLYCFIFGVLIQGSLVVMAMMMGVEGSNTDEESLVYREQASAHLTMGFDKQYHHRQVVNNKDSLQTLVPQQQQMVERKNSSLLNIFKYTQPSQSHESSLDDISAHSKKETAIITATYPYHADSQAQALAIEKNMIAKFSNSLLPPHLQKGESDIIVHRRRSEDNIDIELAAIPMIPSSNSNNNSWHDNTAPKKFISLQDWERNKHTWNETQKQANRITNNVINLSSTIQETDEELTFQCDKEPQSQSPPRTPKRQLSPLRTHQIHHHRGSDDNDVSPYHGYTEDSPVSSVLSDAEDILDQFSTLNSYYTTTTTTRAANNNNNAMMTDLDLPAGSDNVMSTSITGRPARRLSTSPVRRRSPSKTSKPSSPIKRFFSSTAAASPAFNTNTTNTTIDHYNYTHGHSKSMYNFELQHLRRNTPSLTSLSHHHPAEAPLNANIGIGGTITTTAAAPRSKSLSPMKPPRGKQRRSHEMSRFQWERRQSIHGENIGVLEHNNNKDNEDDDEEEEEEVEDGKDVADVTAESASPCPSGGFGEYDREKWRRIIKLKQENSNVYTD